MGLEFHMPKTLCEKWPQGCQFCDLLLCDGKKESVSWLCDRPCNNKTDFGYCKTSCCIYGQTIQVGATGYIPPLKKTNADHIRAMTDEELAEWIVMVEQRIIEVNPMLERPALYADWLEWLKEEGES